MLLIFDWDGTLIDSTAKIVRCMQQAAEQVGVEVLDSPAICQIIGLGLPAAIAASGPIHEVERRSSRRRHTPSSLDMAGDEPSPLRPFRLHELALPIRHKPTPDLAQSSRPATVRRSPPAVGMPPPGPVAGP